MVKKNPLRKRFLREFKTDFVRYLVIFLLMGFSIAFVSGFLVAEGSMIRAYDGSFEKYNIENGHFGTEKRLNAAQKKRIEAFGVRLYDLSYKEEDLTNGSRLRIYPERTGVDLACLMEGNMPKHADEIAVDRMYAVNNEISVGDRIGTGTREWTVTGFVALPDYSALFEDNNDAMFDAVAFGVAVVSADGYEAVDDTAEIYCTAWKYDTEPADETAEKEIADGLLKVVRNEVSLQSFVPRYLNQGICFTGEDLRGDSTMMTVLLYIIIAIIAFVFAVTINAAVTREAAVIGTLMASGYTRRELLIHYMTLPVLVTLVSAVVGNILGYTYFKYVCAGMYYNSYSLPTYVTVWNADAFVKTTLVPAIIVILITWFILKRKLTLSPLKFLRRDLSRRQQRRALPLSKRIPIFSRFRIRVLLQNAGNYGILFIGVIFANLLLIFGMGLPAVLDRYQKDIEENLIADYQYLLTVPADAVNEDEPLKSAVNMLVFANAVETDNEDAEKFSIEALKTVSDGGMKEEEVLIYGISPDSRYVHAELGPEDVLISESYADKYGIGPGDEILLREAYGEEQYAFTVTGIYGCSGTIAVFMDREKQNAVFDRGKDFFCGYFSDTEITDIDEKYIGTVMDLEALTKISRQLQVSFGGMMKLVNVFALVMFMILIFLLSRMIIEKNAKSISMVKILGYTNGEIDRLYNMATTIAVIVSIFLSFPIEKALIAVLFRKVFMAKMTGWMDISIPGEIYLRTAVLGIIVYAVVAVIELARIRRVPMDAALKDAE